MPLHPQAQAIVDAANAAGVPFEAGDAAAIRASYGASTRLYVHPTQALDSVVNLMIPGPGGNLPVRIYRPRTQSDRPLPAVAFFHGGGWAVGDLDTHDHLCRSLAGHAGVALMAVDYRLAPEYPFPAASDDALTATRWLSANAVEMRLDPTRLAVAGDSAGGNLAAAVTLAWRTLDLPKLRYQLLIYPALDFTADNESLRVNGSGYMLTRQAMDQFTSWYLPDPGRRTDPQASPFLAADLNNLPAALIITAGFDPLRDEAIAYAEKLRAAGIAVAHDHYDDMIHGFARMGGRLDTARVALERSAQKLREALLG